MLKELIAYYLQSKLEEFFGIEILQIGPFKLQIYIVNRAP